MGRVICFLLGDPAPLRFGSLRSPLSLPVAPLTRLKSNGGTLCLRPMATPATIQSPSRTHTHASWLTILPLVAPLRVLAGAGVTAAAEVYLYTGVGLTSSKARRKTRSPIVKSPTKFIHNRESGITPEHCDPRDLGHHTVLRTGKYWERMHPGLAGQKAEDPVLVDFYVPE